MGVLIVVAFTNAALFGVQRWIAVPLGIPSDSMEPHLRAGDRIVVRRTNRAPAAIGRSIDRGDVVVFRAPSSGRPLVVKRIVALPGETIQAVNGVIAIDDTRVLEESWLPRRERAEGTRAAATVDIERTELDDDEVYVLGDNRDNSTDSRVFGPVRLDAIVGTDAVRFWPLSRVGQVDWT